MQQIRRFEQMPFVGNNIIPDEVPLPEASNLLYRFGSEWNILLLSQAK